MIDFIFGALLIWCASSFHKHYKMPARASRSNIRTMALIIMVYAGGYGVYHILLSFGVSFGEF